MVLFNLDLFVIQPYFVTGSIVLKLNTFIVGPLLKFLSVVEVFSANNHWHF